MSRKTKIKDHKEKYFYPFVFLIIVLSLWQFSTKFFGIQEYILPLPSQIWSEFQKSWSFLMRHSLITLQEVISGFIVGAFVGFVLAIAIFSFKILYRTIFPLLIVIQSVPKVALAPLFIIWFGFDILPKVLITALLVFFPVLINTIKGLMSAQAELLDLVKSLRASTLQILLKIRLPSSVPYFFASLKISSAWAVAGAIIGEFVGADRGLGYVIMLSSVDLNTSRMFAALVLLGIIGLSLFGVICGLERVILPWHINNNH